MKIIIISFCFLILMTTFVSAQKKEVSWKRDEDALVTDVYLFHSGHAIILPTAETLHRDNFEFEISHRFYPPISEGSDALYGFDGPANMRLGLGYGITDRLVVALARSNLDDNLEFQAKYRTFQLQNKTLPIIIAVQAGLAWNLQSFVDRKRSDSRNFQYYGQLIINTMHKNKIGIGIVPTYIINSDIFTENSENTFSLGTYAQYYIHRAFSLLFEWNPNISGHRRNYNSGSFGIEIETGGHFFKIIVTNNVRLNLSQFAAGSENSFDSDQWRFGFSITRLLKFW